MQTAKTLSESGDRLTATETLAQLNSDIAALSAASKARYVQQKSRAVAALTRETLFGGETAAISEFGALLNRLKTQTADLLSLCEISADFDVETQNRIDRSLRRLLAALRAAPSADFPFRESAEICAFARALADLLAALRPALVDARRGCAAFLATANSKRLEAQIAALEERSAAFDVLLKLQPRAGGPSPFDEREFRRRVAEVLSSDFPEIGCEEGIREALRPIPKSALYAADGATQTVEPERKSTASGEAAEEQSYASRELIFACELFYGFGNARDLPAAFRLFKKLADKNDPVALHYLAKMYQGGIGVAAEPETARRCFERAAELGHVDAAYEAGKCAEAFGGERSLGAAARFYAKAMERGHADATCDLAFLHEQGIDGAPNFQRARDLYALAAERGSARAMNNLAGLLLREGGAEAARRAFALYGQAAEQGCARAMTNLGVCYLEGIHVPADLLNARTLFERAAAAGEVEALFYTAYFQLKEAMLAGSERSFAAARALFVRVVEAEPEHSDAHFYLAHFLEHGLAAERDRPAAIAHLRRAVAANPQNSKAAQKLAQLCAEDEVAVRKGFSASAGKSKGGSSYEEFSLDVSSEVRMARPTAKNFYPRSERSTKRNN